MIQSTLLPHVSSGNLLARSLADSSRGVILALFLAFALGCQAADTIAPADQRTKATNAVESATASASSTARPPAPEKPSVTHHSLKLAGETLHYTATAGYLPLTNKEEKLQAEIFFVAYTEETQRGNRRQRPLSFVFNGGPGASSVWLHLGGIGPKRVPLAADGTALPRTVELVDNQSTWLEFTDLVFVDPVGTGYSYPAPGVKAEQFYALQKDIETAAEFIRLYVTEYERWLSPKLIVGESYGTTRAAGLAPHLQKVQGLDLSGLVLLSSALDFQAFTSGSGNDLAYALALPSLTAVAAYHKELPPQSPAELTQNLPKVEHWALNNYLTLLAKGDTLTEAERNGLGSELTRRTGLSTNYLALSRCRVSTPQFAKELLRSQGLALGMLDGRVTGTDVSRLGEQPQYDPALFLTTAPYVAALYNYLRCDLNFHSSRPYEFLSRKANHDWKWVAGGPTGLYVGDDLAEAMSRDPRLRVFAGAGYYDLTTPYLGQRYVLEHLGLEPGVRTNLTFKLYFSGHQIYTDFSSLKRLTADVAAFVRGASGQE